MGHTTAVVQYVCNVLYSPSFTHPHSRTLHVQAPSRGPGVLWVPVPGGHPTSPGDTNWQTGRLCRSAMWRTRCCLAEKRRGAADKSQETEVSFDTQLTAFRFLLINLKMNILQ